MAARGLSPIRDAASGFFLIKRAIATDLLAATDAVLAGERYVSPEVNKG